MSLDGYIDDATASRLVLSGAADLDRVDALRASCDAICVGAGTIRSDNPRLVLRSQARRAGRIARGTAPDPIRIALAGHGELDPSARFFADDGAARIVYTHSSGKARLARQLGDQAEVVAAGDPAAPGRVLADLAERGVARLLVEGGSSVHTQFLVAGLADELQLAIAPFFVGDSAAPRFVTDGAFPWDARHPARLVDVGTAGDLAVLRYALSARYAAAPA